MEKRITKCLTLSDSDGSEYEDIPSENDKDAEEYVRLLDEVKTELKNLKFSKEEDAYFTADDEEESEEDEESLDLDLEIVNDLINKVYEWCNEWDLQCSPEVKLKDVERELRLMAGDFFIKKKSIN